MCAELCARADLELSVDTGEARLDRLRADEEGGCHLAVGQPAPCKICDALLRRGQRRPAGRAPAERSQLASCPGRPERGAERLEALERLAEQLVRAPPLVATAQEEPEREQRPCALERHR